MFLLEYAIDILYLIAIVVIIAVFAKRGFIQSLFKYGKSIVAVIAALSFGPSVGNIIFDKFVFDRVNNWVIDKSNAALSAAAGTLEVNQLIEELPFLVKQFVSPDKIKSEYGETVSTVGESIPDFAESLATPIANVVSNLLAYILVFICAIIVLWLLGKLLDLITRLPIVGGVNTFLGALLGAIAAFLVLSLVTYVISLIIGLVGNVETLESMAESSYLFGLFSRIKIFNLF